MSGYQEAITDPSYAGQLIIFTYPHIGNYGVTRRRMESDRDPARAVIMRAADRPRGRRAAPRAAGSTGSRTAASRDHRGGHAGARPPHPRRGAMRGGVFPAEERGEARDADRRRAPDDRPGPRPRGDARASRSCSSRVAPGRAIAAIDTGIKGSIVRNLRERGARSSCTRARRRADELLARGPTPSSSPTAPVTRPRWTTSWTPCGDLVGKVPVWGICLGHQLLCRAVGLETFKLPFGHRGANHPVKDLGTGRIEITSQNHGFAVSGRRRADDRRGRAGALGDRLRRRRAVALNLYDRTVEGLALRDVPAATVQYHPEAGPGPHDALHLFDRFLEQAAA